jgi:hypothetical protein
MLGAPVRTGLIVARARTHGCRTPSMGLLLLAGCNFQIPSPTYISETKLISVKAEVTELGPLNPDRVGVPFDAPIAEAMPGDRLALEAVVVTPDGELLGPGEIESIWFQCGESGCMNPDLELFDAPEIDVPCDELDSPTLDLPCRLGRGDARVEFEVSELDEYIVTERVTSFYGVFAWNGRSAEDCWAARRARNASLDDCAFMQRDVKIGPSWWMLVYAESIGIPSPIPIWQIPAGVYGQPANRVPTPRIDVRVDGELQGTYPDTTQFTARLGDRIHLDVVYDELEQLTQYYFYARLDEASQKYWFDLALEFMVDTPFTTGSIHVVGEESLYVQQRDFVVDEYGEPGSAQLFFVYTDDRYGEGVARLDFEVE